tara:strand:- start:163 stop:846 length:684 start_codon:yes stop_codon:yes gene_type:complete
MMAWEPSEDDVDWTQSQLDSLAIDDIWNTGDMQYQRTGETELTLISRAQRAEIAHERVLKVLSALEWSCVDENAVVTPDDPVEQLVQAQEQAQTWKCPSEDCDGLVKDCELEDAAWVNGGMYPAMAPDGTETEAERWFVDISCGECDTPIRMNPLDYALLAGDDLFHTYRTDAHLYRVLPRELMIELIDAGDEGIALGSTDLDGNPLPPHLQGTYCLVSPLPVSEEE